MPITVRISPRVEAFAFARAELEDVPLSAIIHDALTRYAYGKPQPPERVKARLVHLNG